MSNTENANKLRQDANTTKQTIKSNDNEILLAQVSNIQARLTLLENKVQEIAAKDGESNEALKEDKTESKEKPKDKEVNDNTQK